MKQSVILLLVFTSITLVNLFACQQKLTTPVQREDCENGLIIKKVEKQTGKIYFNTSEKKYAIHAVVKETYDALDIGFPCNLADSLKHDGLSVTFDGVYYLYEKDKTPPIGGAKYYYLNISNFQVNNP